VYAVRDARHIKKKKKRIVRIDPTLINRLLIRIRHG
jgi:hypothetical protein